MQSEQLIARVYERFPGGKLYEQALLVIWFLVIGLPLDGMTPFRYLFILYFLSFFLFDSRNVLIGVAKAWWLLPFQLVALLSVFWSPYASEAFRSSLLMILAVIVVIVVAAKYTPQQIIRCLMIALACVAAFIIVQPIPIAVGAGFGSKNYAAQFMLMGFILAATIALNPKEQTPLRLFGVLMIPIFSFLVVSANSTTSLLMLIASAGLVIGMRLFFIDSQKVRHLSALLVVLGLLLTMIVLYSVIAFVDQQVVDSFLGMFGKDSTFTGRTALWDEAANQIGMRPYLGVGLDGFWQYDVGSAQTLNINDHKPIGTRLTFHNVHLEIMVHLGIIGYSAFLVAVIPVLWFSFKHLITRHDMPSVAFCAVIAIGAITSFTESWLWSGFNVQSFLVFVSGAVYARGTRRRHVGNMISRDAVPA
ncbi:MAG: O-antigen ligase family protein [Hyphomonas sp.]|nr:O-antigen ligase family protein [Hyphomonas sp.]